MALGVKWRNFVNSAELTSKARTGPGPGSSGGTRRLWLHPLPALPHPNPYFFLLPILEVFEWRKWQMAFSLPILERTNCEYFLCIHPNYVRGLGVTEYCKLRLPLYFWVSFDGFHLPQKQNWWLWLPWSHSRDFCSDESRCGDNHAHWKSLEACRAKLSSDLTTV